MVATFGDFVYVIAFIFWINWKQCFYIRFEVTFHKSFLWINIFIYTLPIPI